MKHETIGNVSLPVNQPRAEGHSYVPVKALELTPNQEKLFEILETEGVIPEKSIRAKLNVSSGALYRMKEAINVCGEIIKNRKKSGYYIVVAGLRPDHEGLHETFDKDVPLTPSEAEVQRLIMKRPGISLEKISEATGSNQATLTTHIIPSLKMRGLIEHRPGEGYFAKGGGE